MEYLPRTEYEAIAKAVEPNGDVNESVHALIETHRLVQAQFTPESDFTPRERAFAAALRAHGKPVPEPPAKVEDVPLVVDLPVPPKRKKI